MALDGQSNPRMMQFLVAKDTATDVFHRYRAYAKRKIERDKYFISIDEYDDLYEKVQSEMIETIAPENRRALVAELKREYNSETDINEYRLAIIYDGKFATTIDIGGYNIHVKVTREPDNAPSVDNTSKNSWIDDLLSNEIPDTGSVEGNSYRGAASFTNRIVFTCTTLDQREAVLDWLEILALSFNKKKPKSRFYVASSMGSWTYRKQLSSRSMDTVILPEGDKEKIIEDVERFMAARPRYADLGQPWHRGYLFHGPPGTGKTSLASAIASHLNHDVYFIQLSAVMDDAKLQDLISNIQTDRAVLLIEDIDIASAATERNDKQKGVTLTGLLNVLDGVGTPDGLVTVVTTNNRAALQDALIRAGRIDFDMEVGFLTNEQLNALVIRFHGEALDVPEITGNIAPADVVGLFKNETDGNVLRCALHDLIEFKNKEVLQ